MHFISCPPISRTQSTEGSKNDAAVEWEIVSTTPISNLKADLSSASPYPVEQLDAITALSGRTSPKALNASFAASIGLPLLLM